MHTLGWIGTGQMGIPMVLNLLKAGCAVNVYNRTQEKTLPLVAAGAKSCGSPREIVQQSELIFLMLANGAAIRAVLEAEDGLLAAMQPGKIIVDMSTIAPEDSRAFARQVADRGGRYLDAPVSGSVGAAQAAQLVILAGGNEGDLAPLQPYFAVLGKKTMAFGGVGKGSSAKLAINLLLGILGQGLAETLLLAEAAGLEQDSMLELIGQSAMNTGLFQLKKAMYRHQDFSPAFMLELMTKDLGLIVDAAKRLGLELPLARTTQATYATARDHGKGKLDMAAVYLELKEKNAGCGR